MKKNTEMICFVDFLFVDFFVLIKTYIFKDLSVISRLKSKEEKHRKGLFVYFIICFDFNNLNVI
jgi:hypothetical protein